MKRSWFFTLAILLACTSMALAEAGWPIPSPKYSLIEAAKIAQEYFDTNFINKQVVDPSVNSEVSNWYRDFIMLTANYTDKFNFAGIDKKFPEHAWIFWFIHPIHNDNSVVLKVDGQGIVEYIGGSE